MFTNHLSILMISIIIPTCNRVDLLTECLDLLVPAVQLNSNIPYEVIVTDDSKDNRTKKLITEKYPWIKWVDGPKRGPAANRNFGAKHANGDWLIFLDDDCLPQPSWISAYTEAIKTSDFLILEGTTATERPQQRFDEEAPVNLEGNCLWSCNFAVKKSLFDELNGFDESFPYAAMEDVDFHTRVRMNNEIKFVPGALVIHPWRKIKPFKNFKKHLFSQIHFAKKHHIEGKSKFRWERTKIFIGALFYDFKSLIRFSLKGWLVYIENCFLNFCLIFI
ncbi:MAG: pglI [Daejeonella sp.]|nr:pglI [Daejeonella sp.]